MNDTVIAQEVLTKSFSRLMPHGVTGCRRMP
jgi:hypothetical protein